MYAVPAPVVDSETVPPPVKVALVSTIRAAVVVPAAIWIMLVLVLLIVPVT